MSQTGVVKWFSQEKGYGFIVPNDGGKDLFVHWKGIAGDARPKNLEDGQHVEFDVGESHKGPVAENVKVVQGSIAADDPG